MNQFNQIKTRLSVIGLAVLMAVTAACGGGNGAADGSPAEPTGVQASAGSSQTTISWSTVTGASSYNVYYGTTSGVTIATGTKMVNATSPQVVTGLTDGTTYYFVVTAVNANGESVISSEVTATPQQPPASPTGIVVSGGDGKATVSWNYVTGTTSYNIYYSTAAGVTIATGTKLANVTTPQVVTGLADGTTYYFVVTAVNAGGESGVSVEKSATPAATPQPPASPGGIVASGGDSLVTVSWDTVTGATSYNIYYGTSAGVTIANGTQVANVTSPQVVNGLINGTTYHFVVTAVNASGESGVSSEKSATPSATPQPPGNPTGLKLTSPSAGQVSVTWNAVTGATSYNVYYLLAASQPTNAQVLAGAEQSSSSASLTLSGLTSGSTYYVLVTAVNAAGESGTQTSAKPVTVL